MLEGPGRLKPELKVDRKLKLEPGLELEVLVPELDAVLLMLVICVELEPDDEPLADQDRLGLVGELEPVLELGLEINIIALELASLVGLLLDNKAL